MNSRKTDISGHFIIYLLTDSDTPKTKIDQEIMTGLMLCFKNILGRFIFAKITYGNIHTYIPSKQIGTAVLLKWR